MADTLWVALVSGGVGALLGGVVQACARRYEAFVENMNGHSNMPGGLDGQVAMAQCKQGDTAHGIPVLEGKLQDAKIALPGRN